MFVFTLIRLTILLCIGLLFVYSGVFNPTMLMSANGSDLYHRYGLAGMRAAELTLGLALVLGSTWLFWRRFGRPRGPVA